MKSYNTVKIIRIVALSLCQVRNFSSTLVVYCNIVSSINIPYLLTGKLPNGYRQTARDRQPLLIFGSVLSLWTVGRREARVLYACFEEIEVQPLLYMLLFVCIVCVFLFFVITCLVAIFTYIHILLAIVL